MPKPIRRRLIRDGSYFERDGYFSKQSNTENPWRINMKYCGLLVAACLAVLMNVADAAPFRSGTATIDITPPIGYRMSGYFHERLSEGTKDPLLAKAIVFSQGDVVAALVCCDVIGIDPKVSRESRRLIAMQFGIPVAHVSITATHSHTGPLYWGALRDQFHEAAVAREGTDPHETFDYPAFLVKQLVAVVGAAREELQEVRISAGFGHESRVAFNRRFLMKDGHAKTWIGLKHPDVVGVAGPIDPEVGLIRFDTASDKKLSSVISSYALHLDTVGGQQYSADFPFYVQQALTGAYGAGVTSLFGSGTCGDINHVDTESKERNSAEAIGGMLAESILKALPNLEATTTPSLAVRQTLFQVPVQQYSADEVAAAKKEMEKFSEKGSGPADPVLTYKIVALQVYEEPVMAMEVQVFRLGDDVAIVTLPGEVFVEFGLQIKAASPFATTLVIELANDAPGYIPTKKAFVEGGYETVNSRIAPGGGEKMAEVAITMLQELHEAR